MKPTPRRSGAVLLEPSLRVSSGKDVAELIFKHLRFALGVFGSVMILTVAFVYLQPPIYEATAKVLIERGKRPTQRSDTVAYPLEAFEVLTSEMEIIRSRAVAEDVVDKLGLADRPVRDTFSRRLGEGIKSLLDSLGLVTRLERRESLIRGLQKTLLVEPAPQSSVLVISYFADSASDAAEIARAVTESYLVQHRRIFREDTAAFFEGRAREINEELADLRARLRRETDHSQSQSLFLEVSVLEKAYAFNREKLNAARADMGGDESLVNVRIIDSPVVPARPSRSRLFFLILATGAGVVLSISLALVREYFDHTIYSERDIHGYLDLTVLGSVAFVVAGFSDPPLEAAASPPPASSREPGRD